MLNKKLKYEEKILRTKYNCLRSALTEILNTDVKELTDGAGKSVVSGLKMKARIALDFVNGLDGNAPAPSAKADY